MGSIFNIWKWRFGHDVRVWLHWPSFRVCSTFKASLQKTGTSAFHRWKSFLQPWKSFSTLWLCYIFHTDLFFAQWPDLMSEVEDWNLRLQMLNLDIEAVRLSCSGRCLHLLCCTELSPSENHCFIFYQLLTLSHDWQNQTLCLWYFGSSRHIDHQLLQQEERVSSPIIDTWSDLSDSPGVLCF